MTREFAQPLDAFSTLCCVLRNQARHIGVFVLSHYTALNTRSDSYRKFYSHANCYRAARSTSSSDSTSSSYPGAAPVGCVIATGLPRTNPSECGPVASHLGDTFTLERQPTGQWLTTWTFELHPRGNVEIQQGAMITLARGRCDSGLRRTSPYLRPCRCESDRAIRRIDRGPLTCRTQIAVAQEKHQRLC